MPQVPTSIGQLNRRVTIVQRSSTTNAMNEQIDEWDDKQTVWARIDIQYSALTYETSEFVSKATYRISMRWNKALGLKVQDRLRYVDPATGTTHLYEIESIVNDGMQNRELWCLAYELQGSQ